MLEVGEAAPAFRLQNHRDEPVALADFAGRRAVVYFFPRADTPGCTTEACDFRDTWAAYERRDVAVVGISDDPVADLADFAASYELPFPLLSDPEGEVAARYDSYGEKRMFGRTFDGVFRNTYLVGPDGRIEAAYPDVDPEGHAAAIIADLDDRAEG